MGKSIRWQRRREAAGSRRAPGLDLLITHQTNERSSAFEVDVEHGPDRAAHFQEDVEARSLANGPYPVKRGITVASVSAAGIIGSVTTPLPVGTLNGQYEDYDVAGDANGHEVAVAASRRHGLEFT